MLRSLRNAGGAAEARALKAARIESAAVLGFPSAIGACGGYLIPGAFGASIRATGGPHLTLAVFIAFYVTCVVLPGGGRALQGPATITSGDRVPQHVA